MARLFSLANAGAIDDPEYGHFDADPEHGGFDLPDELSDRVHRYRYRGRPAWETETERSERMHGEESARRRDPENLYNAVEQIANVAKQLADLRLADAAGDGESAKTSGSRKSTPAAS